MRKIIIALLVIIYIITGSPKFLMEVSEVKCLFYHIFHANIFHLAVNCLSIWMVFSPRRKLHDNISDLLTGYVLATLSYLMVHSEIVGISNIIYAVIGLRTPAFSNPWWKSTPALVFFVVSAAMLAFPQLAAETHIISFLLGTATAVLTRYIYRLSNDCKRAGGR